MIVFTSYVFETIQEQITLKLTRKYKMHFIFNFIEMAEGKNWPNFC